jgi:hypothetical protein
MNIASFAAATKDGTIVADGGRQLPSWRILMVPFSRRSYKRKLVRRLNE